MNLNLKYIKSRKSKTRHVLCFSLVTGWLSTIVVLVMSTSGFHTDGFKAVFQKLGHTPLWVYCVKNTDCEVTSWRHIYEQYLLELQRKTCLTMCLSRLIKGSYKPVTEARTTLRSAARENKSLLSDQSDENRSVGWSYFNSQPVYRYCPLILWKR